MKSLVLIVHFAILSLGQVSSVNIGTNIQLQIINTGDEETDHVKWDFSAGPNPFEIDNVVQHTTQPPIWVKFFADQSLLNCALPAGAVSHQYFIDNALIDFYINTTSEEINYIIDHKGGSKMRNQTKLNFYAKISHELTDIVYDNYLRNKSVSNYSIIVPLELSRYKRIFSTIIDQAPLNVTITAKVYFMYGNNSLTIAQLNATAIFNKTQYDSDYEGVSRNANRILQPKEGLRIMQSPSSSISHCDHGGQLDKDGFCKCTEGFSGPACMFPCPSSAGGAITPESCAGRSDECVLGLPWFFNTCDNGTVLFSRENIFLDVKNNNTELRIDMEITNSITQLPTIHLKFQIEGVGQLEDVVVAKNNRIVNYTLTRLCPITSNNEPEPVGTVQTHNDCPLLKTSLPPFRTLILTMWLIDERITYQTQNLPKIAQLQFESGPDFPSPPQLTLAHPSNNPTFSLIVREKECTGMLEAFEIECVEGCDGDTAKKQKVNVTHNQDCRLNTTYDFKAESPFFEFYSSKKYWARTKNTFGYSKYGAIYEYKASFYWQPWAFGVGSAAAVIILVLAGAIWKLYPKWKDGSLRNAIIRALAGREIPNTPAQMAALVSSSDSDDEDASASSIR